VEITLIHIVAHDPRRARSLVLHDIQLFFRDETFSKRDISETIKHQSRLMGQHYSLQIAPVTHIPLQYCKKVKRKKNILVTPCLARTMMIPLTCLRYACSVLIYICNNFHIQATVHC